MKKTLANYNEIVKQETIAKYSQKEALGTSELSPAMIELENRIDRVLNDLDVIKQEIVFSRKFDPDFIVSEVPIINIYREYFKDLKAKILYKFPVKKLGNESKY